MRALGRSKIVRTIVLGVVGLLLLGGAFYGGRVYQNNADQKLFAEYNPPQTSRGSGGNGAAFSGGSASGTSFGGGASQNAQVNAALSVGDPPATPAASGGSTSGASGTAGGSAQASGSTASTSGAASGASGSAGSFANRPVVGQLVSINSSGVTLQSFQGSQSLPTTAQTRYYLAVSESLPSLQIGDRVAISVDPNDSTAAATVTIAPTGSLFGTVRSFGGFGGGNSGGSGGFGSGGAGSGGFGSGGSGSFVGGGSGSFVGGGSGNSGGGSAGTNGTSGFGRARRAAGPQGTITAVSSGSITMRTIQGQSKTFKLASATQFYRMTPATSDKFKAGTYVSVRTATVKGNRVAADVVASTVSGTIASISS